jgi:hypothetical protein
VALAAPTRRDRSRECSRSHQLVAAALIDAFLAADAFLAERSVIEAEFIDALDYVLTAHRLWRDWMTNGWVQKHEIVAVKTEGPHAKGEPHRGWPRSNG